MTWRIKRETYQTGREYWTVFDREGRRVVCNDNGRISRFPSREAATAKRIELKLEEQGR